MSEPAEQLPDLSEEEILSLLETYRTDFLFFAPRVLKVQAIEGKIVPFELNGPQQILHRIVERIKESGRLLRLIALKARRMGFSTYFAGRFYHKISWNHNLMASLITHEPEATDTLFGMVKRYFNLTPEWMRPQTLYDNTRLLEFNTKDRKGLGSAFRAATAAKEDFGSGQLIHFLLGSELSKWPEENIQSLLTSVLQCVPRQRGTEVVFESTAKGIGGVFYERFWKAKYRYFIKKLDAEKTRLAQGRFLTREEMVEAAVIAEEVNEGAAKENQTTAIFLPWFCFEEYQMTPPPGFKPLENVKDRRLCEVTLQQRFNLTDAQLYWWRFVLNNDEIMGSIETMMQEYPSTPEEAFISTGRPVFDNLKLMSLKDAAPKPRARYDFNQGTLQFSADEEGLLKVWQEPKAGRSYLVSADVAEGLEHGDNSSADVIDRLTGEQAAHWCGKLDPDQFAYLLAGLGKRYNGAMLAPERNNHGLTVVKWLTEIIRYTNLYMEMVPEPPGKPRRRYGWVTSSATRPLIIDTLKKEVRDGGHGIACAETFEEMMSFKIQANGKMEADAKRLDDRVLSIAIGKHLNQTLPRPEPREDMREEGRPSTRRKPPTKGWT